jgi:hypothetical protein
VTLDSDFGDDIGSGGTGRRETAFATAGAFDTSFARDLFFRVCVGAITRDEAAGEINAYWSVSLPMESHPARRIWPAPTS